MSAPSRRPGSGSLVRLATFNVLHGRAPCDDRVDVDRFAAAVRELDADVLALQEVDRGQARSHGADLTAVAAEAMAAVSARFVPALSGQPGSWSRAPEQDLPGSAGYGVALLSRHPVADWQVVRLPVLRRRVPVLFRGRRRPVLVTDEPRVAVVAQVGLPGGQLCVVSTHLSFLRGWNVVQLRYLSRALAGQAPLVLTGDLNMGARTAVRASGLRPLALGDTFPAHDPRRQLDHLLARGVRARSAGQVRRLPVSDHCALTAEVAVT